MLSLSKRYKTINNTNMGAWIGSLALLLALWNDLDHDQRASIVARFSQVSGAAIGVLVAATIRSQSGFPFSTNLTTTGTGGNGAQWLVPNTVVQQLLGRLPPGALVSGTTLVPLLDTDHRLYGPRRNQVDMRFAKIIRYRQTRTNVGVDLGNILNSNQATAWQSTYAYGVQNGSAWLEPTQILQPRFARFSVTFNF